MKTQLTLITLVGLTLSLGTALASTMIRGQSKIVSTQSYVEVQQHEVTPEQIAMWKATAASTDFVAPKVPL
jgi:hypothetical protein